MSYTWSLIRGASANPSSLKFQALMNKQSLAENEIFKPDTSQPGIISTHVEDTILIQDPIFFRKLRPKTIHYCAPFEPDGVYLVYWCKFNSIARKMKDYSFTGNYTYPHGNPKLCEGPDDGVKGGRIISRINSNINSTEYYSTPETAALKTAGTTGFSIYLEFIVESMSSADGAVDSTLHYKYDDSNNFRVISLESDGTITFRVKKAGVDSRFESPPNAITSNQLYRCCFTYDPSGNVQQMRINNISQVDSGNTSFPIPSGTTDMIHGKRGSDNSGIFVGRLLDSRMYNLVFNGDMMDNIWNNGRSICAATTVSFDGSGVIDCTNDATLWSQSLTKFSFSFWWYPTTASGYHELVTHGGTAGRFLCGHNFNDLFFKINFGAGDIQPFGNFGAINKWRFVVCTFDSTIGTNRMKIYLDGSATPFAQDNASGSAINLSAALQLGSGFQGYMKDFRWWTTKALTPTELLAVRDNRSDAPLPNYWLKMSQGNGSPSDWITRTKTATLTNGTAWKTWSTPRPTGFGSLAVAGYTRFNDTLDTAGFDAVGYDTTGFDAV